MSKKWQTGRKFEVIESSSGAGRVDRAAGIIRGVKILGSKSLNGRTYTRSAMEQAAQQYDGMRVNIDHPEKQAIKSARGTMEQWGWLEGIEVRNDGVYGDLHYIKSHPNTAPLLELAERRPDKFGLSHNADCSGYINGGQQIIESVEKVRSVDVVQRPATNVSLFEADAMASDSAHGYDNELNELKAIALNGDLTADEKLKSIATILKRLPNSDSAGVIGQEASMLSSGATEGYSELPYRDSQDLARMIKGKTRHVYSNVTESRDPMPQTPSYGDYRDMAKAIRGKR